MNDTSLKLALERRFATFALSVNLELPGAGITVLFGPSGSGKTTLLRGLAGLDRTLSGRISVRGEVWQDSAIHFFRPAEKRPVGYVFQDAALFPHLRVRENLDFGWKRSEVKTENRESLVNLLGLEGLMDRYPSHLSGGEQQRVAIARALFSSPRLLLMDEPLAALDQGLKREILSYLERIHQTLEIPILYVTHSPEEVLRLADHLVLMADGQVTTSGALNDVLPWLENFPGFEENLGTVISGILKRHWPEDGVSEVQFEDGTLWLPGLTVDEGQRIRCRIHPGDVSLSRIEPSFTSTLNVFPVTVDSISAYRSGQACLVSLRLGQTLIFSSVTRKSQRELDLKPGLQLYAQFKATCLFR